MCALLAVETAGSGEPLVLLHGLATDRRIWRLVAPALARRRMVVTVDLPGFGASVPVGEGYDLGEVADRIARGLAAHGIRAPYDLVGHSLGGGVALTLASRRPRTVSRLVLVAPAGFQPLPQSMSTVLAGAADAVLAVRREAAGLASTAWGRRLLLLGTAADGAAIPPTVARQMVGASASAKRTAPALREITASDLRPLLVRLRAPLGVIWGQSDLAAPVARLSGITELRPDVRVIVLRDAGHVPMLERPRAFVEAVEQLLDGSGATVGEGETLIKGDTTPSAVRTTVM